MDQESFRKLLQTPGSLATSPGSSHSRVNRSASTTSKAKTVKASEPLFKPRKLKKSDDKYRDRAAERRQGGGNDFAHVEALLEDFERRNADNEDRTTVEEQRKYLGGDSEHSILVKGLDMALLEQNKARAAEDPAEDDDILEQAYLEASTTVPKKRTREDLIKELKTKRAQPGQGQEQEQEGETQEQATAGRTAEEEARLLELAKQQGKFKPIGFKPVGVSEESEKKKKKKKTKEEGPEKDGGERKKKKRKVGDTKDEKEKESAVTKEEASLAKSGISTTQRSEMQKQPPAPEPNPSGDDFDIFAGAGEYEGIDLGDDEEEEEERHDEKPESQSIPPEESKKTSQEPAIVPKRWVAIEDDLPPVSSNSLLPNLLRKNGRSKSNTRSPSPSQRKGPEDVDMENGEAQVKQMPVRLRPLETSALPSIRDFLAMDEAAGAAEKKRKRKEKKKSGAAGGGSGDASKNMEAKVNRDLQRLQSYTSKKEKSNPS